MTFRIDRRLKVLRINNVRQWLAIRLQWIGARENNKIAVTVCDSNPLQNENNSQVKSMKLIKNMCECIDARRKVETMKTCNSNGVNGNKSSNMIIKIY